MQIRCTPAVKFLGIVSFLSAVVQIHIEKCVLALELKILCGGAVKLLTHLNTFNLGLKQHIHSVLQDENPCQQMHKHINIYVPVQTCQSPDFCMMESLLNIDK